ncbi:hypothetical protein [Caulobacter sp. NIBR1757]|uniref:hypothetical protein n=1 Tax=Caulobacter sp. NIBR1757 TaxID=3016000 RepID=UPI0022F01FCE|nr:hypothetical protein [Caulobacter sp. NIBR1757]WGM37630.1 hypothetical protein AMEJIAPC_00529 [Caulobacter sp. NIBR1757]
MKSFALALALLAAATPAAVLVTPAAAEEAKPAYSTAATPLGELIKNPETKAVLEKHIPGISTNAEVEPVLGLPLKQIQGYAPDRLPDALLAAIDADLAKVPAKPAS